MAHASQGQALQAYRSCFTSLVLTGAGYGSPGVAQAGGDIVLTGSCRSSCSGGRHCCIRIRPVMTTSGSQVKVLEEDKIALETKLHKVEKSKEK